MVILYVSLAIKCNEFINDDLKAGIIFGTFFSGLLLHYLDGWHSVFYVFGGIGIITSAVIVSSPDFHRCKNNLLKQQGLFCYNSPKDHPFISEDEREYLRKELKQTERIGDLSPTPWKSILTSPAVLALICAQV